MEKTQLGLTRQNYGKRYNIISTHLSGPEILNDENLVGNSLIISSPVVAGNATIEDKSGMQESHSLFFTDYNGNPARLTYTIMPGNGLVVNAYGMNGINTDLDERIYSYDTLSLEIDKDSLQTISLTGQLHVSKPDIIDNYTLMVTQELNSPHSYISVITANLEKATSIKYGIVRGDNNTISANNGILTVNTENLQYVDDSLNHSGIVRYNPDIEGEYDWRTIEANNGVLRVLTYNLDRATASVVGVVKPDTVTTYTEFDGTLSVRTAGLEKASYNVQTGEMTYGIVRPDNHTVEATNGVLYANSRNMTPTGFDTNGDPQFGVIKLDSYSFGITRANVTYVNRYPEVIAILDRYLEDYTYIMNWLVDHENRITALEKQSVEYIHSFNNYGTTITTLDQPVWDPAAHVVHSEEKHYSVQFSISTNCKFHISISDLNNVSRPITLHSVKFGDNPPVSGSGISNYMFESTNLNESTLNFDFLCDNYTSESPESNTATTIKIRVSSINDASIYKEGIHVFKRWNTTAFIVDDPVEPEITYQTRYEYITISGQKTLEFVTNDNNSKYELTKLVTMGESKKVSSSVFYIKAVEKIQTKTIKHIDEYQDGVLYQEDAQIIDMGITSQQDEERYLIIPLKTTAARNSSDYCFNITYKLYERNNITNGPNNGWGEINDVSPWFNYYLRNASILGQDSQQTNAIYNILDIISTTNIGINDRKASIILNIESNNDSIDEELTDWDNTELILNYIEDIVNTQMNVHVESEIPQVRTNLTPETLFTQPLLQLSINRTAQLSLEHNWTVNLQYCFNTISGTINKNDTEVLSTSEMNIISSLTNNRNLQNLSQDYNKETEEDENTINTINKNSANELWSTNVFNKIEIRIPAGYSEDTITISVTNEQIIKPEGIELKKAGTETDITVNDLVPQSVVAHFTNNENENIISGFKIINCVISGEDFNESNEGDSRVMADVTWESHGVWSTYITPNATPSMTFGNASISNITIKPWDDTRMQLEFNIVGGTTTNIPVGSIIEPIIYGNIIPDIVLYNGNQSHDFNDYYETLIVSNDGWTSTGVKMNMILNNIPPVAPDPNSHISWTIYSAQTNFDKSEFPDPSSPDYPFVSTQAKVYTVSQQTGDRGMQQQYIISNSKLLDNNTKGTDGMNLNQHQTINSQGPMISSISGIRFNFVLKAQYDNVSTGKTEITTMNFAASLNLLSDKVNIDANYNNGASKDIMITNAFYSNNVNPNIINSNEIIKTEQENNSVIAQMSNELEKQNEIINALTQIVVNSVVNNEKDSNNNSNNSLSNSSNSSSNTLNNEKSSNSSTQEKLDELNDLLNSLSSK